MQWSETKKNIRYTMVINKNVKYTMVKIEGIKYLVVTSKHLKLGRMEGFVLFYTNNIDKRVCIVST
jgi:hypothetical protein